MAAFFTRYHEDPPRLDRLRAGLEAAVRSDADVPNLVALAEVCFLWADVRARTPDERVAAYAEGRDAGARAIEQAPRDPQAHLWYAIDAGRWAQARGVVRSLFLLPTLKREIRTLLALDPTLAPVYALAGNVNYEVPSFMGGDLAVAEQMFRKGLVLAPHFTEMRVGLAKVLMKQGRAAEAKQELARVVVERQPDNPAEWTLHDRPDAQALLQATG